MGAAGLKTRPALQPSALISCSVRSTCVLASGWKLIRSAPALANCCASASTGEIIRCTSMGTGVPPAPTACFFSAWQIIGPKLRLGT